MQDNIKTIRDMLNEIASFEGIAEADIPEIALYMDQVTTFMDMKLSVFKRRDDDKILTKTMINNYVKSDLVPPPGNKKYDREQIMLLSIIYHLKQIISLVDMSELLKPVIDSTLKEGTSDNTIEKLYGIFNNMEKEQNRVFAENIESLIKTLVEKPELSKIPDKSRAFLTLFVIALVIQAEKRKCLAEKIIDSLLAEKPKEKDSKQKKKEK